MNHSQGAWKFSGSLSGSVAVAGREYTSQLTLPANGVPPLSFDGKPSSTDHFAGVPMQLGRGSNVTTRVGSSALNSFEERPPSPAVSWPSTSGHNVVPPAYLQQNPPRPSFDFTNRSYSVLHQGNQQFVTDDKRNSISGKLQHRPQFSFTPLHHLSQQPVSLQQQLRLPQESRQNAVSSMSPLPPQTMLPSSLGYTPLGHGLAASNAVRNPVPGSHPSVPFQNVSNGSLQFQAPMAPLPLVPRPYPQFVPLPQSSGPLTNQSPTAAISGLLSSLVAQGLFPSNQTPVQVSKL